MKIWRVENNKREGCYRDKKIKLFLSHHNHSKHTPTPYEDIKIQRGLNYKEICGFKNLWQALQWFSLKDLFLLNIFNYNLKKIRVKKITVYGDKQIIAIR